MRWRLSQDVTDMMPLWRFAKAADKERPSLFNNFQRYRTIFLFLLSLDRFEPGGESLDSKGELNPTPLIRLIERLYDNGNPDAEWLLAEALKMVPPYIFLDELDSLKPCDAKAGILEAFIANNNNWDAIGQLESAVGIDTCLPSPLNLSSDTQEVVTRALIERRRWIWP